ncbi:plasmid mobilization relaxosome protein MobC [Nguyenibacter vanlangensis]|uniref:Plasmid mobilization relaxosome protein MobC n=1 Tax=Nguyenibacter vanlangensis TaxID=1216886 RepID=A0ABZ3D2P2_9PROT
MASTARLHSFRIRASRADLDRWAAAAEAAGLPRTSWLRALAADASAGTRHPAALADELRLLRRELFACGNNLNQIAHRLNSGDHADPAPALEAFEVAAKTATDFLNDAHAPLRVGGTRRKKAAKAGRAAG